MILLVWVGHSAVIRVPRCACVKLTLRGIPVTLLPPPPPSSHRERRGVRACVALFIHFYGSAWAHLRACAWKSHRGEWREVTSPFPAADTDQAGPKECDGNTPFKLCFALEVFFKALWAVLVQGLSGGSTWHRESKKHQRDSMSCTAPLTPH